MSEQRNTLNTVSTSTRVLTTLLASGWGLLSAYILFYSLLVSHDARPCLAAVPPLVAVWATLERKRWGRHAMLGLSTTALGMFTAAVGYIAYFARFRMPAADQNIAGYLQTALKLCANDNPVTAILVLTLALTTGIWMRRASVVHEFERGKRSHLAVAQKAIALSLVGCWGVVMAFTPLTPTAQARTATASKTSGQKNSRAVASRAHGRQTNKRTTHSASSVSSL